MQEREIIECAYEEQVRQLFVNLYSQYAEANGSQQEIQSSEQRFLQSVTLAKRVRDRATTLIVTA